MKNFLLILLFFIFKIQQSEIRVGDGEPVQIKINGAGKQKITLKIDDHVIEIPINNVKVKEEHIPKEIQNMVVEKYEMGELLNNEGTRADKNDEAQALISSGFDEEQALKLVENREASRELFDFENFDNKIEDYVKKIKDISDDENLEEMINKTRFMEDKINIYLRDQRKLMENDSANFDKYNSTIRYIQNKIENLFSQIREDYVQQKPEFESYNHSLKNIRVMLKKAK